MKNKIARRLTKYFAWAMLLFALLAGLLFSVMFARHTADVTKRDLCAHAASIAETIAHFTDGCEEGECKGGGFKAYMRYIGDAAMSDLALTNAQGEIVLLGEMALPETPLPAQALELAAHVFESSEMASGGFSLNPFHPEEMIVCAPVSDGQGGVLYALVMRMKVNSVVHALEDAFYMLSACLLIAMTIAMVVSRFLSRRFVNPLNKMMDAATKMAQGDYSAKTCVAQQDEIGVLAAQIDKLADKLDEAQQERSRFDQMRQDFFSDISHELRTPISVVKGNVELLREGMISDPAQIQQCYDQLDADTHHLQRLVGDMLELCRLQNAQFHIEMEIVNLADVIMDSVRTMRRKADERQIAIRMDQMQPFAVMGDYGRLRQLMIILLDNAVKFSPEGAAVHVEIRQEKDTCEVAVADHGCGIEPEALEHIFDRYFHRPSNTNRGGTGLGLPIAQEIALRHGLEISCRSTPGEGARFRIAFPACAMTEN